MANAELRIDIAASTGKFSAAMKDVSKQLSSIGKKVSSFSRDFSKISLPLGALGGLALKSSIDFNKAIANIGTLIPGSQKKLQDYKNTIRNLSVETGKSSKDLADGLFQVISAFGDSAESVKTLEIAAKASVAGLSTTTDALNLISAATKGYGDTSAIAQQKVVDLAFLTNKLGQTTFPELAANMGKVIPIAKELGISQEELFATFATLTGVTGNTSEVSTQLAGAFGALLNPSSALAGIIENLGFKSGSALIAEKGLAESFKLVTEQSEKLNIPLGKVLGRKEAMIATLALVKTQSDKYTMSLKEMQDAAGAADEAFKEQTEGVNQLGFTFAQLREKINKTASELGDELAPTVSQMVDDLTPFLDGILSLVKSFASLSPETKKAIIIFGAFVTAIAPIGFLLSGIISAMSTLASVAALPLAPVIALGAVFLTWFDPIAFWKGIDAIEMGFVRVIDYVEKVYNSIKSYLVDGVKDLLPDISKPIEEVSDFFAELYDDVVGHSYIPDLLDGISSEFKRLDDVMVAPTYTAVGAVANAFEELAGSVGGSIGGILKGIGGANFENLISSISNLSPGLFGGAGGLGNVTGSLLAGVTGLVNGGTSASKIGGALGGFGASLASGSISTALTGAITGGVASSASIAALGSLVSSAVPVLLPLAFSGIGSKLGEVIGGALGLGGPTNAETLARIEVEKFINEQIGQMPGLASHLFGEGGSFSVGSSSKFNDGFNTFEEFGKQAGAVFDAVGKGFVRMMGITEEIGGQIGYSLAENLGGDVDKLRMLVQGLGLSFQDFQNSLQDAAYNGEITFGEMQVQLQEVKKAFEPGLQAVGDFATAFSQFAQSSAKDGRFLVAKLKTGFIELQEAGVVSFDDAKQKLAEQGVLTAQQLDALFTAIANSGIKSFDEIINASDQAAGALIGDAENLGFNFAEVNSEFQQFAKSFNQLAESGDINKKVILDVEVKGDGALAGQIVGSKDGNVFKSGQRITAFAKGGVVNGLTFAAMKGGLAMMGEKGAEAVLPLQRDAQGRLGVASAGGGVTIYVDAKGAQLGAAEQIRRALDQYFSDNFNRKKGKAY